jgi:ATP-dependent Clp protease ATP-binding subunit ClpB
VDEIVVFHPLSIGQIQEIVNIQLNRVEKLVQAQGFSLNVSEKSKQYLADQGFNPDYGARPLKRTIQKQLQDPLALSILSGEFKVGDTIEVNLVNEELEFTSAVVGELI